MQAVCCGVYVDDVDDITGEIVKNWIHNVQMTNAGYGATWKY